MPTGPKGQKRPADVIGAAVRVMRIATGEEEEELDRAKSAAAELGSRGGKARAAKLSPKRRAEIAKKAAKARWRSERKPAMPADLDAPIFKTRTTLAKRLKPPAGPMARVGRA
jgi:hypothetical protein